MESRSEVRTAGIEFPRRFTRPGQDPFQTVEWDKRTAEIRDAAGEIAFRQEDVEFPKTWSQRAADIVTSKYFRGKLGTPQRESSLRAMLTRIADTLASWGTAQGYFASDEDGQAFRDELVYLMLHQYAAFNSPVQFNMGVREHPQCSACFINSVNDSMPSIMALAATEAMIFKGGSGSGVNLSSLRSSREYLSTGGTASGPVSFMRGYDSFAGAIKSGGATRRAAKMVILDVEHPDIVDFIWCKAREEEKARRLIEAGYGGDMDGEAYGSVQFQNANNSVAVPDAFMRAAEEEGTWTTREVTTSAPADTYEAGDLLRWIAEATWACGDPGLQFRDTINRWHTCPESGPIHACNPCSEYVFLDNSACNLSSLNLMRFCDEDGAFDMSAFRHAVRTLIAAQEIIVDNASYPTPAIERTSHDYRTLGLGFANLGAFLMSRGLPYDSEPARQHAAALTAVMTGEAYRTSAELAAIRGPFAGFAANREPMLRVIEQHREALSKIDPQSAPAEWLHAAIEAWDQAAALGKEHGFRNAQVTLLAPTGTIAFMMDCDTTGIEPEFSLVKVKKLVGGGVLRLVNAGIGRALEKLGYPEAQVKKIVDYVETKGTIEGAPHLSAEHLAVFDCADRVAGGSRSIAYSGHIRMCGAVQPFLSGAISKTINLPEEATVEDIELAYAEAWQAGMKSVSIYRDGSKKVQPLSNKEPAGEAAPAHRNLPKDHPALQHEFRIQSFKGFLTMGLYPDGTLGEIFLNFSKQGSTLQGMAMAWAIAISMGLQRGVPLEDYVRMFSHMSFEPSGRTDNPRIPFATSIPDYAVRHLAACFLSPEARAGLGIQAGAPSGSVEGVQASLPLGGSTPKPRQHGESMVCGMCGNLMQRNGRCWLCPVCGSTSGCS